jgi:hypothetical protein
MPDGDSIAPTGYIQVQPRPVLIRRMPEAGATIVIRPAKLAYHIVHMPFRFTFKVKQGEQSIPSRGFQIFVA